MPPLDDSISRKTNSITKAAQARRAFSRLQLVLALSLAFALFVLQGCHKLFGEYQSALEDPEGDSVCEPGSLRCNEEYLLACNDSSDRWSLVDTCATAQRCDSTGGSCRVCEPGALRCNGAWREGCADDGSRWIPIEECESPEMCNPTFCGFCRTLDEVRCAAEGGVSTALERCDPQTGWQPLDSCDSEVLCRRTVDIAMSDLGSFMGACMEPVCETPGELRCVGNVLERCSQGRHMWNQVDVCQTGEVCALMLEEAQDPTIAAMLSQCVTPCGPAGSYRCDGQTLLRCRDDQTGEDEALVCPQGRTCDPAVGECRGPCTAGEYRCNGAALELCNTDQQWELSQECATRAQCELETDSETGSMSGHCEEPACPAGGYVCDGAQLRRCNEDRTAWVDEELCATPELCSAADESCRAPECAAGERRCHPSRPLELQHCSPSRDGWETITICAENQACNPDAEGHECLEDCPANPFRCIANVRQVCNDDTGVPVWTEDRTCNTPSLCQCALGGTCVNPTDDGKCGQAICGENLPDFNCAGATLQACAPGRDQWTDQANCGASNLCTTGTDGNNGRCLACPVAGEIQCFNDNASRRTCSADRSEWTDQQTCGFGCIDSENADYCAVCFPDELRCDGDDNLLLCGSERRSLVLQEECAFSCLANGTSDRCAPCAAGETRCTGSSELQQCASDLGSLEPLETCEFSCIDSGQADFCGSCEEGDQQCTGNSLETCSGGVWNGGMDCMFGCIAVEGAPDSCARDCVPGSWECDASLERVRECGSDGTWQAPVSCPNTCIESGTQDFCAPDCAPGQTECAEASGSWRQCDAATGEWVSEPMPCPVDTPVCFDDRCAACNPDEHAPSCADNASGVGQRTTCVAGVLTVTPCSSGASCKPSAACGECTNGDVSCVSETSDRECMGGAWVESPCDSGEICTSDQCEPEPGTGGTGGVGGTAGVGGTGGTAGVGGTGGTGGVGGSAGTGGTGGTAGATSTTAPSTGGAATGG